MGLFADRPARNVIHGSASFGFLILAHCLLGLSEYSDPKRSLHKHSAHLCIEEGAAS
jgi:hypothetical protein